MDFVRRYEYSGTIRMGQDSWEIERSRAIVRDLVPKVVVEIGVDCGATLSEWARFAHHDAMLIGVDSTIAEDHTIIEAIASQRVECVKMHSRDAIDYVRNMLPEPISFLFIDADHSYEGVRSDYDLYSPLMARGGMIGFHDVADTRLGPYKLWGELLDAWRESGHWQRTITYTGNPGMGTSFILDWQPRP